MRSILLCAFVAACGGSSATTTTAATPTATTATTTAPADTEITVGHPPPAFTMTASDGTTIDIAALKGKPIVLYFYPKDETPGCTTEACSFRDEWDKIQKSGVVLVGISADTDESHRAFAAHHNLPFHLVSDTSLSIAKKFGVETKATEKFGTIEMRQTIVIGKDGNVLKIYRNVDPTKHAAEIEGDLGLGGSA
jgi:peroxiredoxin Q/BCP